MHTCQYPILGELTKDILVIPVSTVASESAFSTGARSLSLHHSRFHSNTLESLMYAQNWIWASSRGIKLFELCYNIIYLLKMLLNLNMLFLLLCGVSENEIFIGEEVISDDDDDGAQSSSCLT